MKYVSTRGGDAVTLDEALAAGIAKDGGLFVPAPLPEFTLGDFEDATSIHEVAEVLLNPFFEGSELAPHLEEIISETLSFPIPLTELSVAIGDLHMLELFHGPTAAFKDIGASFLAACLSRLHLDRSIPLTILVATSGDTNNVLSLAVQGSFDDCQALVKEAMADPDLNTRHRFSSANSINIGRLLPQCTYYAHASLARYRESGQKPSFIVPTGNLGNGLALLLCKKMGLPVADVILATNENRVIGDYLESGEWLPAESKATLASAMDVGNPSNMERVLALFVDAGSLHRLVRAVSVSDQHIEEEIREGNADFGFAICPHTATACHVYRHLSDEERRMKDWIVVATAHPAKFEQIVEPLTGQVLVLPDPLRAILDRPVHAVRINPDLASFQMALEEGFGLDAGSSAGDK